MVFKEVAINKINQFSKNEVADEKGVYLSLVNLVSILNSIKFTNRIEARELYDLSEPKKYFTDDSDYYQRLLNDKRTRDLVEFILLQIKHSIDNNLFIIPFPTSFILSVYKSEIESLEEYKRNVINIYEIKENIFEQNLGVFLSNSKLLFPEIELILVVDGQHRLAALKAIYYALKRMSFEDVNLKLKDPIYDLLAFTEKKLDEYKFDINSILRMFEEFQISCTILLDFDIWEQGKIFANVNFNQKAVNKSLYYDIFGSFPEPDKNDIYLAHRWCFNLNKRNDSVLNSKIKMLGTGNGFVSQAFLCDSFVSFLKKGGIWYDVANNFSLDRKDETNKIENFLVSYFNAVSKKYGATNSDGEKKEVYYWPTDEDSRSNFDSILIKTTGLGAIIRLIPFFYNTVENVLDESIETLTNMILKVFNETLSFEKLRIKYPDDNVEILKEKESGKYYFKRIDGNFSSGAGLGLQMKLYKQLLQDLNFENNNGKTDKQISLF